MYSSKIMSLLINSAQRDYRLTRRRGAESREGRAKSESTNAVALTVEERTSSALFWALGCVWTCWLASTGATDQRTTLLAH